MRKWIAMAVVVAIVLFVIASRQNALPPLTGRTMTTVIRDTGRTKLGAAVTLAAAAHPSVTAVHPLRDARDAFAARILLAKAAERSLDLQYYIWHDDITGRMLFKALHDAADRGVRVRLLLDDNNTSGLDPTLAALDAHPMIEVRLFNPFVGRRARWLGYLTSFTRLNRRMHNKSFTADNQVTIVGGRNVGDEYFGAAMSGPVFADLDVIAAGPAVNAVSEQFDRYWSSDAAYPLDKLVPAATSEQQRAAIAELAAASAEPQARKYRETVEASPIMKQLIERTLPLEWAAVHIVSDDPRKVLGGAVEETLVVNKLEKIFGSPQKRFELVSPYFVPAEEGTAILVRLRNQGVDVSILTNALEATDVAVVHAGYAKRRKALLKAGVRLYELRRTAGQPADKTGLMGSSSSSLHAKTFASDSARVFVGSFNFDPRSAHLNTEMGFVIDSPVLAGEMDRVFNATIPDNAYAVHLTSGGELYWTWRNVRYDSEPGSGIVRRWIVRVASWLPIDPLL